MFYNSAATLDKLSYRCKPCDKIASKTYRTVHKERDRQNRKWEALRRLYGLSQKDYLDLWEKQGGKCDICSAPLVEGWTKSHDKHRAVVDHCHETGVVRGLLCTTCNKGLGLLGDTSDSLKKAYEVTYPVATMRRMLKYTKQGFTACAGCMQELLLQTANSPEAMASMDIEYVD